MRRPPCPSNIFRMAAALQSTVPSKCLAVSSNEASRIYRQLKEDHMTSTILASIYRANCHDISSQQPCPLIYRCEYAHHVGNLNFPSSQEELHYQANVKNLPKWATSYSVRPYPQSWGCTSLHSTSNLSCQRYEMES